MVGRCVFVCVWCQFVSPAKTAEPIEEMPFGVVTWQDPRIMYYMGTSIAQGEVAIFLD